MPRRPSRIMVREAAQALENFKFEVANELGIDYSGDLGALPARTHGHIGGNMVRKMIHAAENQMAGKGGVTPQ
ncbi:MAG: alpha/beta-type small acid-soluble spore protein [Firmicutes bacterium]|nr:alpha/beta-type small acid-soluble spore protein [Bacillota bacterium]